MYAIVNDRKKSFKRFNRFLKDNGVFNRYYKILKDKPEGSFSDVYHGEIVHFLNTCPVHLWLRYCFIWHEQKEGSLFWEKLHSMWHYQCLYC